MMSILPNVQLSSYRTQLGVVLQETFLFDGSIRENVVIRATERHRRRHYGGLPHRAGG